MKKKKIALVYITYNIVHTSNNFYIRFNEKKSKANKDTY